MKPIALQNRSSRNSDLRARRGVMMAWSIWVILAAGLIAGGLFNVIWLSGIRNQARHCAESAALAAGHSYLSDDLLRSRQQPFEHEGRAARCQNTAISMVDEYRRHTSLPAVSKEQVRLDWSDETILLNDPSMMVPARISVSFDNGDDEYHVPLFFSGLTGLRSANPGVSSTVVLEHAPAAFRPGPKSSVPMLPFAVLDRAPGSSDSPDTTGHWTRNIESGTGSDHFSWNASSRQFEFGPDGLPEVTVTISSGTSLSGPDAFVPLCFCATRAGQASSGIPEWIENGLAHDDLQTLGLHEVAFPGSLPTLSLSSRQLNSVSGALQRKVGEPFVVCLGSVGPPPGNGQENSDSSAALSAISLLRPVAARIVRVAQGNGGTIRVTLQPCVLATSTAITASSRSVAANRYVYSVRLCN